MGDRSVENRSKSSLSVRSGPNWQNGGFGCAEIENRFRLSETSSDKSLQIFTERGLSNFQDPGLIHFLEYRCGALHLRRAGR